jgi:5-hydroxyisourate hydrolase
MSGITTHVLDTSRGRPAGGVPVTLERTDEKGSWTLLGSGQTDDDGRFRTLLSTAPSAGTYRLTFDTRTYFETARLPVFYPRVAITFCTAAAEDHYHVPLLLSPFGYSTYRGS